MKKLSAVFLALAFFISCNQETGKYDYNGKYCSGSGDVDYLRLIDESFAFLNPNPVVPNVSMLYKPEWGTFAEGAGWGAWWIQNSYGFSYAATPLLKEPWFSLLQKSWDLHWDNQGDGKRLSMWGGSPTASSQSPWVAPDGSLGDMARPNEIGYKQGDGDLKVHDWFYEAAAAGVVMQAEILLTSRNMKAIEHYLPKMERACDFIEKTRDPENNLFLVGPASNLLAPSYGGVKMPDGTFGNGYLAGVAINYLAALDRMVELYMLTGDKEKLKEYERRQKITRQALPLLLTPDGYFVKSIEPGGVKHGVTGQEHYGYLEGVANADAVAMRVVDEKTAENIYNKITSFPEIRPFDFLLTNAPGLDDTYWSWDNATGKGMGGIHEFGCWVNGGAWGTVEGRAILMYSRLGKFEDIRRAAIRGLKWGKDFRFDDHFTQRGENSYNLWYDKGNWSGEGVTVTVDNFAIPAATIRGLFDYDYKSDRLILRPRLSGTITQYTQKEPVRFGEKSIYLSCRNGGPNIKSVKINGKKIDVVSHEELALMYSELPAVAKVEIVTEGRWPAAEAATVEYPVIPALVADAQNSRTEMPDSLKKQFTVLTELNKIIAREKGNEYDRSFIAAALESFKAYQARTGMDVGKGYFREIDDQRKHAMVRSFAKAAIGMYKGVEIQMNKYSQQGDPEQKKIAEHFFDLQKMN